MLILRNVLKVSSPSTVPVQQGSPGKLSNIPGNGQGSLISLELEPYMLEAYLGNNCLVPNLIRAMVAHARGNK